MDSSQCQRTFSLSLVFDGPSSDALSTLKREVSEIAGRKSQDDAQPHITLGMFHKETLCVDVLELDVLPWNERGMKFWQKMGFKEAY